MNKKFPAPFVATRQAISRRRFLRGAGIAMSLPLLDAMQPRFARAASSALAPNAKARRIFGICNNLGVRPDLFFPNGEGRWMSRPKGVHATIVNGVPIVIDGELQADAGLPGHVLSPQ